MTNAEAVNWLINITADIGKAEHSDLWHYEQALSEIREMLEDAQPRHYHEENLLTYAHDMGVTLEQSKKELQKVTEQPETHEKRTETHACDPEYNMDEWCTDCTEYDQERHCCPRFNRVIRETVDEVKNNQWIPCSERLPKDIRPVIVTWKNTDPASYYQYIVGKHYTGTACYKNGKWYWYSSTTEDMLAEYGRYDSEEFDEAIECIAWMPLPEPYKGDE